MKSRKTSGFRATALLASVLMGSSLLGAADDTATAAITSQQAEIARLQAALTAQQKQLESLQHAIDRLNARQAGPSNLGAVASLNPVIPARPVAALAIPAMPLPQKTTTGG